MASREIWPCVLPDRGGLSLSNAGTALVPGDEAACIGMPLSIGQAAICFAAAQKRPFVAGPPRSRT